MHQGRQRVPPDDTGPLPHVPRDNGHVTGPRPPALRLRTSPPNASPPFKLHSERCAHERFVQPRIVWRRAPHEFLIRSASPLAPFGGVSPVGEPALPHTL